MAILSVHGILTYLTFDSPPDVVVVFDVDWFDDGQLLMLVMQLALHWKVVLLLMNCLQCGWLLRLCDVVSVGAELIGT